MGTKIILLLLLFLTANVQARQYDRAECKALALLAGQAAAYRERGQPMLEMLAEFKQVVEAAQNSETRLIRLEGDYEFVEALVTVSYKSTWGSEQIVGIVYTVCDNHGNSRFVREI